MKPCPSPSGSCMPQRITARGPPGQHHMAAAVAGGGWRGGGCGPSAWAASGVLLLVLVPLAPAPAARVSLPRALHRYRAAQVAAVAAPWHSTGVLLPLAWVSWQLGGLRAGDGALGRAPPAPAGNTARQQATGRPRRAVAWAVHDVRQHARVLAACSVMHSWW